MHTYEHVIRGWGKGQNITPIRKSTAYHWNRTARRSTRTPIQNSGGDQKHKNTELAATPIKAIGAAESKTIHNTTKQPLHPKHNTICFLARSRVGIPVGSNVCNIQLANIQQIENKIRSGGAQDWKNLAWTNRRPTLAPAQYEKLREDHWRRPFEEAFGELVSNPYEQATLLYNAVWRTKRRYSNDGNNQHD